jgi:hypothetical protein
MRVTNLKYPDEGDWGRGEGSRRAVHVGSQVGDRAVPGGYVAEIHAAAK